MTKPTLNRRVVDPEIKAAWASEKLTDIEVSLMAARGARPDHRSLPDWLAVGMTDLTKGAIRLSEAIQRKEKIVVVADYDCDGATSCTVAVAGLRALGADIGYVVPDRLVHGYGISPSVVDLARDRFKDVKVIMTVDNGILGFSGITYAAGLGLDIVVTDHHLPDGARIPTDAVAVVDPSRVDDQSGLGKLAGVSVALWMVVETKRVLAKLGIATPTLTFLLPYVAIGTVADMVPLDAVNQHLVNVGLNRMRRGDVPPGVAALLEETGALPQYITTQDVGFGIGPRINAAGRLDTMDMGIELLLATDIKKARQWAKMLTETNLERKRLQKEATEGANLNVVMDIEAGSVPMTIVKGNTEWHPGIVGLVASRLKDTYFRPTFIFSIINGYAKGSGRSIKGFHLKDAMEEVVRRAPGLLAQFGGHAMAAGASLTSVEALEPFARVFDEVARDRITPQMLESSLFSDGAVPEDFDTLAAAKVLRHPWGQHFEAPAFDEEVQITKVSPLGKDGIHWKVEAVFQSSNKKNEVVLFNQPEPETGYSHLFLEPALNTWKGNTRLQWLGRTL